MVGTSAKRKFTISTRTLAAGGAAARGLVVCAVAFGWAYLSTARQDREYRRAIAENARLRSSARQLEQSLAGLSEQIGQFEERTRRLAIVAGLPRETAGVGGPLASDGRNDPTFPERQRAIAERLDALDARRNPMRCRLWFTATVSVLVAVPFVFGVAPARAGAV